MHLFETPDLQATKRISIAEGFTRYPGGRYRRQGKWSGEEFRDDILRPALAAGNVVVDLAGVYGYPSSFLEEAFGGLVRNGLAARSLENRLRIEASDPAFQNYVSLAWRYINEASSSGGGKG